MALPYEKRPPLGYIPGGTVNDVASTLGLSKDPIRAAQEIVGGRLYPLDIGSFGPDRYFTLPPSASLRTCRMRRRRRTSASGAGLRIS